MISNVSQSKGHSGFSPLGSLFEGAAEQSEAEGVFSEIPAHDVMVEEIAAEFLVAILLDGLADALHQPEQIAQVVDRRQP